MSVRAVATLDLIIARETKGTVMVTKIPMMATTTSISTSVKPRNCVTEMDEFELGFIVRVLVTFPVANDAQFFWFADLHPEIIALTIVFRVAGIIFPSFVLL